MYVCCLIPLFLIGFPAGDAALLEEFRLAAPETLSPEREISSFFLLCLECMKKTSTTPSALQLQLVSREFHELMMRTVDFSDEEASRIFNLTDAAVRRLCLLLYQRKIPRPVKKKKKSSTRF